MLIAPSQEIHQSLTRREPNLLFQFAAGCILVAISQFVTYFCIGYFGDIDAFWAGKSTNQLLVLGSMCGGSLLAVLGFVLIVKYLSKRRAFEFGLHGVLSELGLGLLIGTSLVSIPVLILWALGMYTVTSVGLSPAVISALAVGIGPGFMEEILTRGFILRLLERAVGTWWALFISAFLFGLGHVANPNVPLTGAIAIGIEAGLLLGAAYVVTRRLWLAIGIHTAWNAVQGGVWSSPVSGISLEPGIVHGTFSGPVILTGGPLGIEGSILALIVCLVAAAILLRHSVERGYVIRATNWPPRWMRKPKSGDLVAEGSNGGGQRSEGA